MAFFSRPGLQQGVGGGGQGMVLQTGGPGQSPGQGLVAPDGACLRGRCRRPQAAGAPQPETVHGGQAPLAPGFVHRVAVQQHLDFVHQGQQAARRQVRRGRQVEAAAGGGGKGRQGVPGQFGRPGRLQAHIPAAGRHRVEAGLARIVGVEAGGQGFDFGGFQVQFPAVGDDDLFLVQAQVDGVGTEPDAGVRCQGGTVLSQQAQGAQGLRRRAQPAGRLGLGGQGRAALQFAPLQQGGQGRAIQGLPGQVVFRFGPQQFGNEEGEAHGQSLGGKEEYGGKQGECGGADRGDIWFWSGSCGQPLSRVGAAGTCPLRIAASGQKRAKV